VRYVRSVKLTILEQQLQNFHPRYGAKNILHNQGFSPPRKKEEEFGRNLLSAQKTRKTHRGDQGYLNGFFLGKARRANSELNFAWEVKR
jgi:hypothetical protein